MCKNQDVFTSNAFIASFTSPNLPLNILILQICFACQVYEVMRIQSFLLNLSPASPNGSQPAMIDACGVVSEK